jgi:hypothetical protein
VEGDVDEIEKQTKLNGDSHKFIITCDIMIIIPKVGVAWITNYTAIRFGELDCLFIFEIDGCFGKTGFSNRF